MLVKLQVIRGQPQGQTLQFACGEFLIGRGEECHLRPNSAWVSRQHCLLRVTREGVHLQDLGSTNGTLINGNRLIGERALVQGDHLQVGPMVFAVTIDTTAPTRKASDAETALGRRVETVREAAVEAVPPV